MIRRRPNRKYHARRRNPDYWLTREDIQWRPEVSHRFLNWNELRRLRERLKDFRIHDGSYEAAWQNYLQMGFSMIGTLPVPQESVFQLVLRKWIGIGQEAADWRWELWYNITAWELYSWYNRILEKAGYSDRRAFRALLKAMPTSPRPQPRRIGFGWSFDDRSEEEFEIVWRWYSARGWYLNEVQWRNLIASHLMGIRGDA